MPYFCSHNLYFSSNFHKHHGIIHKHTLFLLPKPVVQLLFSYTLLYNSHILLLFPNLYFSSYFHSTSWRKIILMNIHCKLIRSAFATLVFHGRAMYARTVERVYQNYWNVEKRLYFSTDQYAFRVLFYKSWTYTYLFRVGEIEGSLLV